MSAPPILFESEAQSATAFDAIVDSLDLFATYKEVRGTLLQPRPGQRDRGVRIDRVLIPNSNLLAAGWKQGLIGVEIKKDSVAIGPYLAQAMDYSRSVWTLPGSNFQVMLDWVFVWPIDKQSGAVASIMAQNKIGSATANSWTKLQFKAGECNVLRVNNDESVRIGSSSIGQKVGSR